MKKTKKPKTPPNDSMCVLFVVNVPRSTKNAFKAAAAAQGLTMRAALVTVMQNFAAENSR